MKRSQHVCTLCIMIMIVKEKKNGKCVVRLLAFILLLNFCIINLLIYYMQLVSHRQDSLLIAHAGRLMWHTFALKYALITKRSCERIVHFTCSLSLINTFF